MAEHPRPTGAGSSPEPTSLATRSRGRATHRSPQPFTRSTLPPKAAATLRALTAQFARAGTDGLESPEVFRLPAVGAGGLAALKDVGRRSAGNSELGTR